MTRTLRWVQWIDSTQREGWHDPSESAIGVMQCESVGFLHDETDDAVTLVQSYDEQGRWADALTIPTSAIVKQWSVE